MGADPAALRVAAPARLATAARPAPRLRPLRWGAVTLPTRLAVAVIAAIAVLALAAVLMALQLSAAGQAQVAEVTLRTQVQMLAKVLDRQGDAALAQARRIAASTAVVAGLRAADQPHLAAALAAAAETDATIISLEVLNAQGRELARAIHGPGDVAAADADAVSQVLEHGGSATGPAQVQGGGFALQAIVPIQAGSGPDGSAAALVATTSLSSALAEIAASTGTEVVLLNEDGQVVAGTASLLPGGTPSVQDGAIGMHLLRTGDRTLQVSAVPLLNGSGGRLGTEVQVRDVTDADGERRFVAVLALFGGASLVLVLGSALLWFIGANLRPLVGVAASLDVLNRGGVDIELAGEDRTDEVGAIARAVRQLRDRNRDLARQRARQERARRRQQRFIAQQMAAMGDALDVGTRDELLANTGEDPAADGDDLGILAAGFRVMSQQAITQHARMDALVAELRDALNARTELIGLQQQFQIATTMQADMLPQALPPRPDIQARGGLLPAREFGGDFYDFFPLGPGQVGVFLGNARGGGLRGAFLTLTARTLLKAVMICGLGPAAAMSRVNTLLAAEPVSSTPVTALVAVLDSNTSRLVCCRADYPEPLVLRRLGDVSLLRLPDNPPLGQGPASYREQVIELAPRTTVLLHSPGCAAAGSGRLQAGLQACNDPGAEAVLNTAMSVVSHGEGAPDRDASCVVLRYVSPAG